MDFNRNHYLMAGLVLLCLGIQLRMVDTYVLNEKVSKMLVSQAAASKPTQFLPSVGPTPLREFKPPQWLGWALMSVGSVLVLHSLAMPKPGG